MTKTDFNDKIKSQNQKFNPNKTKHLLVENELEKLKTFDLSYFKSKSHFEEGGTQNYLVFQPMYRYFILTANTKYISEWKYKRLSDENIKSPTTSDDSISPLIGYLSIKTRLKFNGSCLKQNKITYTHRTIVNIYIAYKINASSSNTNDP